MPGHRDALPPRHCRRTAHRVFAVFSEGGREVRAKNEGSVFELKNGKWRAQISVGEGRYATRTCPTQAAAVTALQAMRQEQTTGVVVRGDLTVRDLLDEWEELNVPNRDYVDAGASIRSHLIAWRESSIGGKRVATLLTVHVEAAMRGMVKPDGSHYSRQTMIHRRAVLGQVFDAAIARGRVSANPARKAELPPKAVKAEARRSFTREQANTIISTTASHRNGAVYLVGLSLGLRPQELFGLTWQAIDWKRGTIHVQRGVRMVKGTPTLVDDLKTSGSLRTIKAPAYVLDALRLHRDRQDAAGELCALVFPSTNGGPQDLNQFRDQFTLTINALGFGDDWNPNEMRHTCASLLLDAGVHLRDVADLLGHTTTKMLELHYRHALKPETDAHVAAIEGLFGPKKGRRRSA